MTFHKEDVTIIVGIGLGYSLKAILEKKDKLHHVMVIDPVGEMFRLGLSNFDFTPQGIYSSYTELSKCTSNYRSTGVLDQMPENIT
jgi:hypothetical protein